jgi:predicted dehydrogenase
MKQPKDSIRIGIIGCGARLRGILKMLLKEDRRLQPKGVCDPDPDSIERARKELHLPLHAYETAEALIADPAIDWVMIGSWNCYHAAQAIAALNAGKNVFCEKPLATNFEDCVAVRDAARRARGVFAFGFVLRYSPHYQRTHRILKEGGIGELISFEFNETLKASLGGFIFGNWRRRCENAGSLILEKCCHDLDLANWMADSLPVRVASFGGRRYFTPQHANLETQIGPESDGRSVFNEGLDPHGVNPFSEGANILDHQVVILEYANNVRATFHMNAVSALPERRFMLLGTLGSLRSDSYERKITLRQLGYGKEFEAFSMAVPADGHGGGDVVMAEQLAKTMLNAEPPHVGIEEAIQSAAVAFAIDQAQASGQVVNLAPWWARLNYKVKEQRPPRARASR